MLQEANLYCHHTSSSSSSSVLFTLIQKKYINTIIIGTKKEGNQS